MTSMVINGNKKDLFENATGNASSPIPPIDYVTVGLGDIKISLTEQKANSKRRVQQMEIAGTKVACTERFMTSFCAHAGISRNIFSLFDHDEVTARIIERGKMDVARICLVNEPKKGLTAMAVSKPGKPVLAADDLLFAIGKNGGTDLKYDNGVVTSIHVPTIGGDAKFEIGGDGFCNRFVVDTPIDGYGLPAAYVSLLRLRCSNGAVGYSKAFKSEINIGNDDSVTQFQRFIDSFNNDEGYDGIRRRFMAAIDSPASLNEFNNLYRILVGDMMRPVHQNHGLSDGELADGKKTMRSKITDKMWQLGGDPLMKFGLASLEQIPTKKLRMLDTDCTVYDLINFASELATHHCDANTARTLQSWIGTTISAEYDLEGVAAGVTKGMVGDDVPDLFMGDTDTDGDDD